MAKGKLAFGQTLGVDGGTYTFTIEPNLGEKSFAPVNTNGSQRGGRPMVHFLDHRVKDVKIIEGADLHPVIADDFILVPRPQRCEPDRAYRVVFHADRIE